MILDLFVSVFQADTKDYEAGAKKVEKSTDEIAESMKNAEKQAQGTTGKFKDFLKGAIGFLGTVAVAGKNVGIAISQADNINTLNQVASSLETNVENLDAFTKALRENGAEAEATEDALRNAFNSSAEAINNAESEQAKIFKQLGISLNNVDGSIKDTTFLITELAGATEKLDKRQAQNMFQKLGITDKRVIDGLLKGRKSLEENIKKQKELGVVTQKQVEIAERYKKAQDRLNSSLENGKNSIMEYIAPAITWLIDKFTIVVDWMNNHQAFVIGFFGTIAAVISTLYLPAMIRAGIATMVAMAPILAIAVGIGILALAVGAIVDEIDGWINGQNSLIGEFISFEDAVKWVNEAIDSLLEAFNGGIESIKNFGSAFVDMAVGVKDDVVKNFNAIKEFIAGLLETVFGAIDKIKSGFNNVKSFLGLGGEVEITEENISKKANNDTVKGSLADVLNETNRDIKLANNTLATAEANPLNKTSSQQISNMSNSKNEQNIGIGEINVNTQATSSKEISSDIKSDLESQLQNLQAESYSGIDI
ncbi:hypothetical protein ACNO6Z_10390 [Aliarcobacter lanthieri]|uniref:hypothetical protein n=1 Tax=Aliarcobacter lanthieri TaxID=1355374 RepID=UPI003AA80279